MAFKILNPWTFARVREPGTSNASLSEIAGMLTQSDATTMDRNEIGSPASITKITWQKAGRVTEPGRYMFKFGWLTVTDDDLAIWR